MGSGRRKLSVFCEALSFNQGHKYFLFNPVKNVFKWEILYADMNLFLILRIFIISGG